MEEFRANVEQLKLDPENPRLPESLAGASQSEILGYLFENAVLDEIARSYINNGFFPHEPLLVAADGDEFVALEGNRRLAALKVLLEDDDARQAEVSFLLDETLSPEQRRGLLTVPTLVVDSREEVRRYLGFRHIGGIKTWSAEAKARYLAAEVDMVRDLADPFRDVARRVGSNVQGVRNAYIAISTLRHAQQEFGVNVTPVQHRRFGVWTRCMNSPELRAYIGIGDPRTYTQVREQLEDLDRAQMSEVLRDLTPQAGKGRALLSDSRDVTVYAQALQIPEAHRALREYHDLELARQIVEQAALPDRLEAIRQSVEIILSEVSRADILDESLVVSARALQNLVGSLSAVIDSKK